MFGRFRSTSKARSRPGFGSPTHGPDGSTGNTALADEAGPVPDDLPRDAFFAQPLQVVDLTTQVVGHDDGVRVSFEATIKDAEGKRCPEIAVHARVDGPHRNATGMGHTSMMGKVTFRMSGPAGDYHCVIEDVAGGALGLDTASSTLEASLSA